MLEQPIYNQDGTIKDYSDEGSGANDIITEVNLHYALKKLKPKHREIAEKLLAGYKYKEIKASSRTISKVKRLLVSIIK